MLIYWTATTTEREKREERRAPKMFDDIIAMGIEDPYYTTDDSVPTWVDEAIEEGRRAKAAKEAAGS